MTLSRTRILVGSVLVPAVLCAALSTSSGAVIVHRDERATFRGVLPHDRPASRMFKLKAGEALKLFAKPTGKYAKQDSSSDAGISIAITADEITASKLGTVASNSSSAYSDGYSDSGYSDYDSSSYGDGYSSYTDGGYTSYGGGSEFYSTYPRSSVDQYQAMIFWTAYSGRPVVAESPARGLVAGGRGWGRATPNGSWVMYVAPVAGSYTVLLAGRGSYAGGYSTQQLDGDVAAAIAKVGKDDFDTGSRSTAGFNALQWADVVKAQLPYLFDEFLPSSSFYTDRGKTRSPYGPTAKLRKEIESQLSN